MKKIILTQNNNILSYTDVATAEGAGLPANEYVDIAVGYYDIQMRPLVERELNWQIDAGNAILQRPRTLTDKRGLGVTRIKVALEAERTGATIYLTVSPTDEPADKMRLTLRFGALSEYPPVGDGPVLQTVFPRDDSSGTRNISNSNVRFIALYSDEFGNLIEKDSPTINVTYPSGRNFPPFSQKNEYLYISDATNFPDIPQLITIYLSKGETTKTSHSSVGKSNINNQATNFWPPSGSILKPHFTYPLRALFSDGNGNPIREQDLSWAVAPPSVADYVKIASGGRTGNDGIATTTITVMPAPSGAQRFTLWVQAHPENTITDMVVYTIGVAPVSPLTVSPQPGSGFPGGANIPFSATLYDANGDLAGSGISIAWDAENSAGSNCPFSTPVTKTDVNGVATNFLTSYKQPQGTDLDVTVTITPPTGEPFTGIYTLTADSITQVEPANPGPYPLGEPVNVSVKLTDPQGNALPDRELTVAPDQKLDNVPPTITTDKNGIARFQVSSGSPYSATMLVREYEYSVPTTIPLTFADAGSPTITVDPPDAKDMKYDTWVPVTATYTDASGKGKKGVSLHWTCDNGVEVQNSDMTTGNNGSCTNFIRYETTAGYPASRVATKLTVTGGGASADPTLTFTRSSTKNKLSLISPPNGSHFEVEAPTTVTLKLVNQFGHALANYPITWDEPTDKAQVLDHDLRTDEDGQATAIVKGTIEGQPAMFSAVVDEALAFTYFHFVFDQKKVLPKYLLDTDKNFAHKSIADQNIDDIGPESRITFTFRINDAAPGGRTVWWDIQRPTGMRLFKPASEGSTKLVEVQDYEGNYAVTKTDKKGVSTITVVCSVDFLGQMNAQEPNQGKTAAPSDIVFATFTGQKYDSTLEPVRIAPDPIQMPEDDSVKYNFNLIAPNFHDKSNDNIVYWVSSQPPEQKKAVEKVFVKTPYSPGKGVDVPCSYVFPDPDGTNEYNLVSYMLIASDAGSRGHYSVPVPAKVIGQPSYNHPKHGIERSLPEPYLEHYANAIVSAGIVNGLNVKIPYSPTWKKDQSITLLVYLNGENYEGIGIGNTIPYSHDIQEKDLNPANGDLTITVERQDLMGYSHGTFAADYYIKDPNFQEVTWSRYTDDISLETGTN